MRFRLTTPLGIIAVLTKNGELYELDVDLPDLPTKEQELELGRLLRYVLAAVEAAETSSRRLDRVLLPAEN